MRKKKGQPYMSKLLLLFWTFQGWFIPPIHGHSPKSSLGKKILAIREGEYKNCFREGEGKNFLGYGKDTGRNLFLQVFHKNFERAIFFTFSLFSQKSSKCLMFLLHQGWGSPGKFSVSAIGGGQNLP